MSDQYFAAKGAKDTASILLNKAQSWINNIDSNGYREKLKAMYAAYHGFYYSADGHQITFSGEQGELVNVPINELRNLASHILVMTTANRPSMEARAVNTDYKSLVQTYLANSILEYYMREKRLENYLKRAVEYAVVLGAGFIKIHWNATSGEIVDFIEDTQTPIYDGDLEFSNLSPIDVLFDSTKESQDHDWVLVRTYKNKFDLAAKYKEYEKEIVALKTKSEIENFSFGLQNLNNETDDVTVYEFYHKRTDSMPNGRYMMFLDNTDIVLHDNPMPYRVLPVFRIAPGDILGTPYGYTPLFDILPIQEILNSLYSTVATNQNAFGVQNIWVKPGSNLNVTSVAGGLNVVESMEKPEPLNLTQTPPEVFKMIEILTQKIETLSGVNSVARGNADSLGSNPSGTAMALIQSMALQFMSGLQQSYVHLIEDIGTAIIKILQDFAETPRLVAIVGKNNRTYMKEFSGKDIAKISRVVVDVGNPLSRTTAGRTQMADQLLQYQLLENPQQYLTLINTGRLDAATENVQHELFLIKAENEKIIDGEEPPVTILDDHKTHITEHKAVLADPDLRKDPDLVRRALGHIQAHIQELKTGNPDLLMMMGQQPLQPMQQPGQPPAPGGPTPTEASQSQMGELVEPPLEGQEGLTAQNGQVSGPGLENGAGVPSSPQVDPSLLPNPELQPQQG